MMKKNMKHNGEGGFDDYLFKLAYQHSPVGLAYFDSIGNWLDLNPALHQMIGMHPKKEVIKEPLQGWLEHADEHSESDPIEYIKSNDFNQYEGTYYLKSDGKASKRCQLLLVRVKQDPESTFMLGYFRDIEEQLKLKEKHKKAREETELLLKEVHHRIKNNLATVSGLLELKACEIKHKEAQEALQESLLRVKSVSKVHELLHKKPTVSKVPLKNYLEELVESIQLAYEQPDRQIEIHQSIDPDIRVDPQEAVPIALLLNELIINAYEHAFTEKDHGLVEIFGYQQDHEIILTVEDDGKGMNLAEWEISDSLGHTIVQTLIRQLNASMEVMVEDGTLFEISMKTE